tara:strand:+ start:95 stop:595 length:501 start_codon:yes stop_codon:yes gene_type:complete
MKPMYSNGNGYLSDYSMSVNAAWAYEDGEKPLSKITLADLRAAGWGETRKLAMEYAAAGIWTPSSWHHCSKFYNKTDFYDPRELVDLLTDPAWEVDEIEKRLKLHRQKSEPTEQKVRGRYTEFTKWGRRWHVEEFDFTGVKRGKWIYLEKGGKKKANGKNIHWYYL